MKIWFSIRTKFLLVMSLLLSGCVVVYLFLATMVFKGDKTELVFDLNRSQVTTIASELESQMQSVADKLKLFALSTQSGEKAGARGWVVDLIKDDENLAFVGLYKSDQKTLERQFVSQNFLDTYSIDKKEVLKTAMKEDLVPWDQVKKSGEFIWRVNLKNVPPLIGFAKTVMVETEPGMVENWAVVGWVRPDQFLKNSRSSKLSEVVVLNSLGEVLAHPDMKVWEKGDSWKNHHLFKAAQLAVVKTQVMSFANSEGAPFLGAFSKSYNSQLLVISQAPESKAFAVLNTLNERSLIFSLIVVTVAFLASVLLSRSLTNPIAELAETMETAGKGDLSVQVQVHSRDETMILGNTFNKMITDLRSSRDELQTMNRELDQKVKDRTLQLEKQNLAVKEAQEALLRTTRLASAGEIAGRAAHEVLNPLTSLLTRMGLIEKRVKRDIKENLGLMDEINAAWKKDYSQGGFDLLLQNWQKPSDLKPKLNLWQEDLENMEHVSQVMHQSMQTLVEDSQFIQSEGQRINRIIHGMRKLSNTNSDLRAESLHGLLDECIKIMGDLFDAEDCKIEKSFLAKSEMARVDKDEFIQALTNMMRNSLQAIQVVKTSGYDRSVKPVFKISTRSQDGEIFIEIEDNGIGIRPENQAKLFESHFTTKSKDEGTGIGLGIARRFLRGHGGEIEFVSSEPLKSTVFRVRLPLQMSQEVAA